MAKVVVARGNEDLGAYVKPFSLRLQDGGRLVLDKWRGVPRLRYFRPGVNRLHSDKLRPWQIWLEAGNVAWKFLPWEVKQHFVRGEQASKWLLARDLYFMVTSGRLFFEVETDQGVYRAAWMRKYLEE